MAQATGASIHIRLNADRDVVPEQRWMYLSKDVLMKHLLKYGLSTWGSMAMLAQRLKSASIRYDQVLHADHLQTMLRREGLPTGGERRLLEDRLASTPPKSPAELEAVAAKVAASAFAAASGATAGGAAAAKAKAKPAADAPPTQWKKELSKMAARLEEDNKKMTKEMCAAQLTVWGRLKDGHTVYHIISPVKGGVDHPDNYCMLPNYFPSDYHLGEAKAKLHHILVWELLPEADVKRALVTSLGEELAAGRLEELKELVKTFKKDAAYCGYTPGKKPAAKKPKASEAQGAPSGAAQEAAEAGPSGAAQDGSQAGPSGAAQDGSQAGPSGAAQEASQAGPNTDARSGKRARTEEEEEGEAASVSQKPQNNGRWRFSNLF